MHETTVCLKSATYTLKLRNVPVGFCMEPWKGSKTGGSDQTSRQTCNHQQQITKGDRQDASLLAVPLSRQGMTLTGSQQKYDPAMHNACFQIMGKL